MGEFVKVLFVFLFFVYNDVMVVDAAGARPAGSIIMKVLRQLSSFRRPPSSMTLIPPYQIPLFVSIYTLSSI